jgi:hypothetical protein
VIVLDRLIRGGGRQAMILADVEGVRASLSEQGAQHVGKDCEVEPVAVTSGVFQPKVSVFSGPEASGKPTAIEPELNSGADGTVIVTTPSPTGVAGAAVRYASGETPSAPFVL